METLFRATQNSGWNKRDGNFPKKDGISRSNRVFHKSLSSNYRHIKPKKKFTAIFESVDDKHILEQNKERIGFFFIQTVLYFSVHLNNNNKTDIGFFSGPGSSPVREAVVRLPIHLWARGNEVEHPGAEAGHHSVLSLFAQRARSCSLLPQRVSPGCQKPLRHHSKFSSIFWTRYQKWTRLRSGTVSCCQSLAAVLLFLQPVSTRSAFFIKSILFNFQGSNVAATW